MRNKKDASIAAAQLLQRAEEKLEVTSPVVHPPATEPDALRLVLELQVYQIELELQNEELQRARDETGAWLNLYTGLYDFAPVGYFTLDRSGCIRRANLAGAQLLGVDRDRLVNLAFDLYVSRDTRDVFASFFAGVGDGHSKQTCEVVLQTEENYPINVRIDAGIYGDKEECQIAVVDITERKQAEQTQREIGDRAQQYLDIAGVMLVGIARDQMITLINKRGCALLGYSQEELLGKNWFDVGIPEHDRLRVKTAFAWMMRGNFEMVEYFENTVVTRSGEERMIRWHNVLLRDATGEITGTLSSGEDITVRKQAEEALQNERDNLAAIFASSPVGMLLIDEESMIVSANSVVAGMVSRTPSEIIRRRGGGALGCIHSFQNEKGCGFSPECLDCPLRLGITQVLAGGTSIHGVEIQPTLLIGGREHTPWLRVSAEPIIINGRKHVIVAMDDITESKQAQQELIRANAEIDIVNHDLAEALALSNEHASSLEIAKWEIEGSAVELSHQATHDSLTDLPNRQFFEQHLADIIASATGGKSSSSFVLFLDLDKFKLINDTLGHKVGDLLLIEVADRLQSCLRSEDLLARMGGDEFTVIIPHCSNRSVAETVALRMIDSISRPFEIQKHRFVIGASIGMARYPNDGKSTITLLKHADAAMYKAKQAGRGRYCWYSGDVDVENQQRADLEMDIRVALDTGQFSVHYQPIISIDDGNVLAAEALLRWEHPDKGMIPPSLFIPVAEEIGAIGPIGDFVLRTSCAQVMAWRDEGICLSQIGVNVSAMQVRDANWLATVTSALADTGLEAECLNLELTETGFADDTRSMKKTLGEVRELGICMAIDDFGTGQSSISRLKTFPVIHLKIDGSFIRDIETDKSDNALVRSIIDMAHSQGMKVTAEWVETEPQMDILRSIGCDYAQGFFISPALPAEAFLEFVRLWTSARQAVATG